jgi:opacity protein-like surface antigen
MIDVVRFSLYDECGVEPVLCDKACSREVIMKKNILLFIAAFSLTPLMAQADFSSSPHITFFDIGIGSHQIETNSAIFDFNRERLIFNPSDLDDFDFSLGMNWQRSNFLAYGVSFRQFNSSVVTEDADYMYPDGSGIFQQIELNTQFIGFSMIFTPTGAGSSFGQHAWAPNNFVPYAKLGLGFLSWEYIESGEFVDDNTLDIYYDTYLAKDTSLGAELSLGMRFKILPKMDFQAEYTFSHAKDSMDGMDFQGFGDLDLSSQTATIGLCIKIF